MAISLLGIILFSYSMTYSYTLQERSSVIESRVDSMNRFLGEVDDDMRNAIYIAGFRAIIGMEDEIANTGVFVDSTSSAFMELFTNGTISGRNSSVMVNNTFPYWVDRINQQAMRLGMNLSIIVDTVNISHVDPWIVRVDMIANLSLSDIQSTANWTQQKEIYEDISVVGFEDPWYAVYTGNSIVKRINTTVYDGNFTSVQTNTTNIRDHVAKTLYSNFTGAPSFLMRFENRFEKSIYGIESFVDKAEVSPFHACPTETSSIDSIYWLCNTSFVVKQVQNWSGFRIDNQTDFYGSDGRIGRYMLAGYVI